MKHLLASIIIIFTTSSAIAQIVCDTRAKLVVELNSKYAESQSSYGMTQSGNQILELFTANSGTWTILLTRPDGTSCAMATGRSWTIVVTNPAKSSR